MRLKKEQREAVIKWVVAGFRSDEINNRAAAWIPPFSVSRGQVVYYRKTRGIDVAKLEEMGEHDALNSGLALVSERVKKLKELAELLENDIFGDLLWTDNVKGVGSGPVATIVDYEEFNAAEVAAYRGVLDDIAKEMSHRVQRQEHKLDIGKISELTDDELRAIVES